MTFQLCPLSKKKKRSNIIISKAKISHKLLKLKIMCSLNNAKVHNTTIQININHLSKNVNLYHM